MKFNPVSSGSHGNLYTIESGSHKLIVDPGIRFAKMRESLKFGLSQVDACLVSHSHADHSMGVAGLIRMGIPVYMTTPTAKVLGIENDHWFRSIIPFELAGINSTWSFMAFPTVHDCSGSVGFLITDGEENLLYVSDTALIEHRFGRLNIIAIEVNFDAKTISPDADPWVKRRVQNAHMSLDSAIIFLKRIDLSAVRQIWIIHISKTNGNPEYFKSEIEKAIGLPVYFLET